VTNNYTIKDSILTPQVFNDLVSIVDDRVHWQFLPASAYIDGNIFEQDINTYSWSSGILMPGESPGLFDRSPDEVLFNSVKMCVLSALDNAKEDIKELYRMRFGLHTYVGGATPPEPHVDWQVPHKVGLLYLNDSDGDTILYKNKYKYPAPESSSTVYDYSGGSRVQWKEMESRNEVEELARVSPKANRLLLFDGSLFHASASPVHHSSRMTLNFNYN